MASGRITLDRYEEQKADIQKLIAEYQTKLKDKADKLHAKDLERLTKDMSMARSVVQPFRNHKVDFMPPQITEKVPLFGTDKWEGTSEPTYSQTIYRDCPQDRIPTEVMRHGKLKQPSVVYWRITENFIS